jgi:hypothetical protein
MSDEPVVFTPRHIRPRLRFTKAECKCGGYHATFWKSTPPPGCTRGSS